MPNMSKNPQISLQNLRSKCIFASKETRRMRILSPAVLKKTIKAKLELMSEQKGKDKNVF